jgi:3-oxoacyl-[acyl-carrier protein] reductase
MGRLAGRATIVTGAAAGIGRAIAGRFAAEGAAVLAVDRNGPGLETTVAALAAGGGRARAVVADVAQPDAPDRIVAACLEAFGRVDVLVNNAGIGGSHAVLETSDEEWGRMLDVNLTSVFRLSRRVLVELRRQGGGRIVNLASVFGTTAFPGASSYSAAKAGVIALTRSMAVDYAPAGVTVNAIAPGLILTDMTRDRLGRDARFRALMLEATPLGRPGTPDDVAGAALFLASADAAFVTGHVLLVDGGWSVGKFRPPESG